MTLNMVIFGAALLIAGILAGLLVTVCRIGAEDWRQARASRKTITNDEIRDLIR